MFVLPSSEGGRVSTALHAATRARRYAVGSDKFPSRSNRPRGSNKRLSRTVCAVSGEVISTGLPPREEGRFRAQRPGLLPGAPRGRGRFRFRTRFRGGRSPRGADEIEERRIDGAPRELRQKLIDFLEVLAKRVDPLFGEGAFRKLFEDALAFSAHHSIAATRPRMRFRREEGFPVSSTRSRKILLPISSPSNFSSA
jgi:hypothetical protein